MAKNKQDGEVALLLRIIDEAYERKAWHGTNLRGSIRGLTQEQAAWRPSPVRHNIWEIVVHAAYWKYILRRRLLGEKKGSFPLKGSNWFKRPSTRFDEGWHEDVSLLDETHRRMRQAIAELQPQHLHKTPPTSQVSNSTLIYGIAAHDLYHAGQIQLLKRLQTE